MIKKVLLLGSGELGRELTIAYQNLGLEVIAVGRYENAPAMQIANQTVVKQHQPDYIVPEIENIHLECLHAYDRKGIAIIPSLKAVELATNRKAMRHLAAKVLKLRTPNYLYASNLDELIFCVQRIGLPCVVKSLSSSSGKGQSLIRESTDIEQAWQSAARASRESKRVIVEQYIPFDMEITLLTVTQKNGHTLFCPPIGHRQQRGDYQESWQPALIDPTLLERAQQMAQKITSALGGTGLWGVEFFLKDKEIYFSEVAARPHDTGLVTLAGTQSMDQFELHARASLGLALEEVKLEKSGASAVILTEASNTKPEYTGVEQAEAMENTTVKIFGKPQTVPYRRMGVALTSGPADTDTDILRARVYKAASMVEVN